MKNIENEKHLLYAVRIILERKEINNIWESHKWVINDLIPLEVSGGLGYPPINDVRIYPLINEVKKEDGLNKNLYFAEASIDLHHAESEGYAENLQSSDPSVYIVLRDGDLIDEEEKNNEQDDNIDIHLAEVSLSPYHIQDYEDCGEDRVEKTEKQVHFAIEPKINKPASILKKRVKRGKTLKLSEELRKRNEIGQDDKA